MKYINYILLAALLAVNALSQIPGTTRVFGPVAPSATNSSWGGATSRYFNGGYQEWFPSVGAWTDPTYLPDGRKSLGMVVSSPADTNNYYVLRSMSPDVWQTVPYVTDQSAKLNANGGSATNLTLTDGTASEVVGLNGSKKVVTTGVTVAQLQALVSGGSTNSFVSLTSMADLVVATTLPPVVFLKSYNASYPNVGEGFWYYDSTSTYATNRAVVAVPYGTATGRYLPYFPNGRIDITRFGAVNTLVNDGAVQDAFRMQQDTNWTDKVLYVPTGNYHITSTLSNSVPNRMIIIGDEKATGYDGSLAVTSNSASRLTMDTANTPILSISGSAAKITDLSLWYNTVQVAANTGARAINFPAQCDRSEFRNLHIGQAAYGVYAPNTVAIPNSIYDNIYISYCSVTAGYFAAAGTTMKLGHWYVQGIYGDATGTTTVSSVSKSGTEITAVLTAIPSNATTNCFIYLSGITAGGNTTIANGYKVLKSVSGTTITYDMASDPGGVVSVASGTCLFGPRVMSGPMMFFGSETEWDADSFDIENVVNPGGIVLQNEGKGHIGNFHSEFAYSNSALWYPVYNHGGTLTIDLLVQINQGAPTGVTGSLVYHDTRSGIMPSTRIDTMNVRDISTVSNTVTVAGRDATTTPQIVIGAYNQSATLRANVTSKPGFGAAVSLVKNYQIRALDDETLNATTGTQVANEFQYESSQTGTAGYTGFKFKGTYNSLGSGATYPFWVEANGDPLMYIGSTNYFQLGPVAAGSKDHLEFNFNRGIDSKFQIGGSTIQTSDPLTGTNARTLNINTGSPNSNTQIGSGNPGSGLRVGASPSTVMSRIAAGSATLVAGSATVALTTITANTRIFLSVKTTGGTLGFMDTNTRSVGVSFTITSASATDTSVVEWLAIEP